MSADAVARGMSAAAQGAAAGAAASVSPNCYGFGPRSLLKWKKALAGQSAGIYRPRIACIGDSTTVGTGSPSGSLLANGVKNNSWPSQLARLMAGAGYPSFLESSWGDFGYSSAGLTYDTRIALGNFALRSDILQIGSDTFAASSAAATPLSFTPAVQTDTCEIYYVTSTSTGTIVANVNGGSNTSRNTQAGSNGVGKLVISGALGSNVYNVNWSAGGTVFIIGFLAYNSASKAIDVSNMGWGGAKTSFYNALFGGFSSFITQFAPDLTILQLGINDWYNSTQVPLATHTTIMQNMITAALSSGDVIVMPGVSTVPASINPGAPADALIASYQQADIALAAANNVPCIDLNGSWGGYAAANARGFMNTDQVHPTAYGYGDEARVIQRMILAA